MLDTQGYKQSHFFKIISFPQQQLLFVTSQFYVICALALFCEIKKKMYWQGYPLHVWNCFAPRIETAQPPGSAFYIRIFPIILKITVIYI